jgi:hypothetical protein
MFQIIAHSLQLAARTGTKTGTTQRDSKHTAWRASLPKLRVPKG